MMRSVCALCCVILIPSMAKAADDNWFTVIWENDFIADDDSGYTNGIAVSWGKQPFAAGDHPNLFEWVALLPGFDAGRQFTLSWRVAQAMFTPDNIEATELALDDRPYAGLLLGSMHVQAFDEVESIRYWGTLGVVGPASGAEHVQKFIHEVIGTNTPNGWQYQLDNELVFMLSGEYLRRLQYGQFDQGLEWDLIGLAGVDVGVLHSEAGAGVGMRLGRALGYSFRAASLVPGRNINPLSGSLHSEWHVFFNVYGRYVANDLPIEGNWRRESHGVTLTHEQLLYSLGGAYNATGWGFAGSIQESSRTFEERHENTLFATFSWTWRF